MNALNNPSSGASGANTTEAPPNLVLDLDLEETDISTLRSIGKELFSKGDYQGALKAYERWLELEPESSMAHSNKSAAHMVLKQWESTYLSARRAQELDPSNVKAAYRRGVALMRMRCYAGAVSVLEALLSSRRNVSRTMGGRNLFIERSALGILK